VEGNALAGEVMATVVSCHKRVIQNVHQNAVKKSGSPGPAGLLEVVLGKCW